MRHESELVFRPSTTAYRSYVIAGLRMLGVLIVVGVVGLVLDLREGAGGWPLGGLALIAATSIVYAAAYLCRAAVIVTPDRFVTVGVVRRNSTPRVEVGVAVLVAGLSGPAARAGGGRLYVMHRDGRRLAKLAEGFWDESTLSQIARALHVHIDHLGIVAPAQVRARYRQAVPWAVARPVAFSLIAVGVVDLLTRIAAPVDGGPISRTARLRGPRPRQRRRGLPAVGWWADRLDGTEHRRRKPKDRPTSICSQVVVLLELDDVGTALGLLAVEVVGPEYRPLDGVGQAGQGLCAVDLLNPSMYFSTVFLLSDLTRLLGTCSSVSPIGLLHRGTRERLPCCAGAARSDRYRKCMKQRCRRGRGGRLPIAARHLPTAADAQRPTR